MKIEEAIDAALLNIAKHGDTDVFPFPFENHMFHDKPELCKPVIMDMHKEFEKYMAKYSPATISSLSQVGYTGFRWAMQIEPFWNAYYLALAISIADKIEAERIPEREQTVFSYRFSWNKAEGKLFKASTWLDYRKRSVELSKASEYVVVTDISDFYPRIYHHRIENALKRLPEIGYTSYRIMELLNSFSKNVSYGLPIGGPASRILAELALNDVDLHLHRRKIIFCRYADDYCIFCNDKSDAYKALVLLSQKLFNEGLSLQKNKTKILKAEEFRETARLLDPADITDPIAAEEQKLLNISIRYDPYSSTAVDDYESLKEAVSQVDIVAILGREVSKTVIDQTVTKQAINAIKVLDESVKEGAIITLLDMDNLVILSPVFVAVMRAVRGVFDDLSDSCKGFVDAALISLYEKNSHILSVELNMSYYVQALSKRRNSRKEEVLIEIFERSTNPIIRRQIILVMADWGCHYLLSDVKRHYGSSTEWERRAITVTSYYLGDEGSHWRRRTKDSWNPMEKVIAEWFGERYQKNKSVPV